ncbi:hypothetical protein HYC85_025257 [Camellia sinensis]|uniref:Helicase protein MOM1 n=1 Tax=Camellia sinensis TaxID=4442 RepID=A0A7J7GCQ5_CAMSI|nr:hypothetical protein HYC85_025257 [Camellia sinensis]
MANDTQSTCKSKDDESNSSKKKPVTGKRSSTPGSAVVDTSGLRRSTRETPSRKQISSSPSTTRKSERIEKRTPTATPLKRKLEIVEKKRMPSPLRRSDRGKKHLSWSSSGSKKSEKGSASSDVKRKKLKREKSVKQLTLGAREMSRREKRDPKPVGVNKKRMDARTYKSLFKHRRRRDIAPDFDVEMEKQDKLSQVDSSDCEGSVSKQVDDKEDGGDECSESMGKLLREGGIEEACEGGAEGSHPRLNIVDAEALGNHGEVALSCSSQKHSSMEEPHEPSEGNDLYASKNGAGVEETLDDAKMVQVYCSAVEKLRTPELAGSAGMGRSLDGVIDEQTGDRVASKRKRHTVEMDCKASTSANKANCKSNADAVFLPSSECKSDDFDGTCVTCSKRLRVDYDSSMQELCFCNQAINKDLCGTSIAKDRGEPEAFVRGSIDKNDGTAHRKKCCDGKGCSRSYHLQCLDPPLDDVPPGDWHCSSCVKKKIESGVYSVSEGVESIWDAREAEVQDIEGLQKQKQYFVKYKGLAHFHNHWVPETQLLLEAPLLVSKFNRKNQVKVMNWREEWRVPHRFLKKRLLTSPKQQDDHHSEHAGDSSNCHNEWLVKWCGLDYEHATWELENASFLHSPQAQNLIREYENRHQRAKEAASFAILDKMKKRSLSKLSKLPAGVPNGNCNHLSAVSKLHEYWLNGQNAVVIDDQERVMEVILFILSLVSDVSQPFLIITNSCALSLWEAEFSRLSSSTNVVVYSGNKDSRRIIRTFELYEEGGCIMFQVLLSTVEAIVEDLEVINCFRWEGIIVDECQHTGISKHFGQIKMLTTEIRVLLYNGRVKDGIAEHLNLLSLLDSPSDSDSNNGLQTDLNDNLDKLRERLKRFVAYRCNPESPKFIEYWVPVLLSNEQLEQYCATLFSNSSSLRSCLKNDPVGALRDILISTRKCCDHPYIADPLLRGVLAKGLSEVEFMDVGIKASGKLRLLDTILSEIKNRGVRVVILFQLISGSGRDSIGDILEDFIRQRFGKDSYERVDHGGVLLSKKHAAMNKFNDKGSERFVFLLENRACLPSIKLSSVDAIVIFDSDVNPTNDLRALHKISIVSSSEPIKIFRLYSCCTVEEKLLDLATHDVTLDSNLQSISRIIPQLQEQTASSESLVKDVAKEFLALVCQHCESTYTNNSRIIKVRYSGTAYSKNGSLLGESLLGELKTQLTGGEPHVFWAKLLEGRCPQWRYSSGQSQRNRKRVHYFNDSPKKPEVKTDEVGKKRKKVVNNSADPASLSPRLKEGELLRIREVNERNCLFFQIDIIFRLSLTFCRKLYSYSDFHVLSLLMASLNSTGGSEVAADNGSQFLPRSTACVTRIQCVQTTMLPASPFPSNVVSSLSKVQMIESEEGIRLHDVQQKLNVLLKLEISKLCEILQLSKETELVKSYISLSSSLYISLHLNCEFLPREIESNYCFIQNYISSLKNSLHPKFQNFLSTYEDVKDMVGKFLEYVVSNHHVNREPATILQAFQISLCWIAASLLKHKVDKKESLALARQHLNFGCTDEEANNVHSKLRLLKKMFLRHVDNFKELESPKDSISATEDIMKELPDARMSQSVAPSQQHVKVEIEERSENCELAEDRLLSQKKHGAKHKLEKKELSKSMKRMQKKCDKRMIKLNQKQHEEIQEFYRIFEEENIQLQKEHKLETALVRSIHSNIAVRLDKLKRLDDEFMKKMEERKREKDIRHKELEAKQLAERNEERQKAVCLLEKMKSRLQAESSGEMPLYRSEYGGTSEQVHCTAENVATVSGCLIEEQNPNELQDTEVAPSDMPRTAASEAVGCGVTNETPTIELHLNHETDAIDPMASHRSASGFKQLSILRSPENNVVVNPPSAEQIPAGAPSSVQEVCESARNKLAIQDECSHSSTSTGMHDGDAPATGSRSVLQQVEVSTLHPTDDRTTDQTNHRTLVIEQAEQLQLSASTDSPVDHNQPESHTASGVQLPVEGHNASQSVEAAQQFEGPAVPSNRAVMQPGANLAPLLPLHAIDVPPHQNQPDLHLAVGNDHQPSSEWCTSFQNAGASSQLLEDTAGVPNQVIPGTQLGMHPPSDTPLGGFGTHLPLRNAHQMASRIQNQPLHADPLQNELERLRKETDQAIKAHEDTKLRLKSDCDKEIEEIVAEIRRKFEAKLQDAEASFLLKKKELDANHGKVLMNKILAEAFRSKCLDLRPSGALGIQQVVPSSFLQHLQLLASQTAPRPSPVTAAASQQTTAPLPQVVHHSSALFSSMPTRPPHIVPITPPTGNSQVVGEIRAPAPHLLPFRPSSSMSATSIPSLPRGLPSQHAQRNLPTISPLVLPVLPRPPPPPPQHEISGRLPSLQNSSPPVAGMVVDIDSQPCEHPPNVLPPLPNLGLKFGLLDLSQFGAPGSEGVSERVNLAATSGVVTDVVVVGVCSGERAFEVDIWEEANERSILNIWIALGLCAIGKVIEKKIVKVFFCFFFEVKILIC